MVLYRLSIKTPVGATISFGEAVLTVAQGRPDVLPMLPRGAADLVRLGALCDNLSVAHLAWAAAVRKKREALARRKTCFGRALSTYGSTRARTLIAFENIEDGEKLVGVIQGSPSPSTLTPQTLLDAIEQMVAGFRDHAELLVGTNLDEALLAKLDDRRLALRQASSALSATRRVQVETSSRRKKVRSDLVKQIRLVEKCLKMAMTEAEDEEALAGLQTLRTQHLPGYSPGEEEAAEDGEEPEDETEG